MKRAIILCFFLLFCTSVSAAPLLDMVLDYVDNDAIMHITPTTAIYDLGILKANEPLIECFTNRKLYVPEKNYQLVMIDYEYKTADGSPKHLLLVDPRTGDVLAFYAEFPPVKGGRCMRISDDKLMLKPEQRMSEELRRVLLRQAQSESDRVTGRIVIPFLAVGEDECDIRCNITSHRDDRDEPPKKYLIAVKGYDHNNAFSDFFPMLRMIYDLGEYEVFAYSPDEGDEGALLPATVHGFTSTWVTLLTAFENEWYESICCKDVVNVWVGAHGLRYERWTGLSSGSRASLEQLRNYIRSLRPEDFTHITRKDYVQAKLDSIAAIITNILSGAYVEGFALRELIDSMHGIFNINGHNMAGLDFPSSAPASDIILRLHDILVQGGGGFSLREAFAGLTGGYVQSADHTLTLGIDGAEDSASRLGEILGALRTCYGSVRLQSCYGGSAASALNVGGFSFLSSGPYAVSIAGGGFGVLYRACAEMTPPGHGTGFQWQYAVSECMRRVCERDPAILPRFAEAAIPDGLFSAAMTQEYRRQLLEENMYMICFRSEEITFSPRPLCLCCPVPSVDLKGDVEDTMKAAFEVPRIEYVGVEPGLAGERVMVEPSYVGKAMAFDQPSGKDVFWPLVAIVLILIVLALVAGSLLKD